MTEFGTRIPRLSGAEQFHFNGTPLPFGVQQFWQWSSSNLVGNALRGIVAEYLVASALGCADGMRVEWDACDVRSRSGLLIEVKTSGYLQSWAQRAESRPIFEIGAKRGWDAKSNTSLPSPRRTAHVYVFALHAHHDRSTLDPLNVAQWEFFVVPTTTLNAECAGQKSIGLSRVRAVSGGPVTFAELAVAIEATLGSRSNIALHLSSRAVAALHRERSPCRVHQPSALSSVGTFTRSPVGAARR